MRESGTGQIIDVLCLAMLIAFGSSLLVTAHPVNLEEHAQSYSSSLARSCLLSLQKVPVNEFEPVTYRPPLNVGWYSELNLKNKTPAQLILEDVLINPEIKAGETLATVASNIEFHDKVQILLKKCLSELVRGVFGYRLIARMEPVTLSSGAELGFELTVENIPRESKRLCSESVSLTLPNSDRLPLGEPLDPIVIITLELWS